MTDRTGEHNDLDGLGDVGRSILRNANVWINVLDADGTVVFWNDTAATISGYSADEVVGHDRIWEWFYPDPATRSDVKGQVAEILAGDRVIEEFETTISTATDDRRTISWYSYPLTNSDGTPGGAVAIGRDVTGRKRREKELKRYETIVETIDDGVYVLDEDGRLVYVNRSYAEMKGVDKDELIGTEIDRWVDGDILERSRELVAEIERGDRDIGTIEYEFRTANGDLIPAELRFTSIEFDDGTSGRVGAIRDISKRKERDRELERQNERLESFASVVSHDLQGPLNVAMGRLDLARERCTDDEVDAHLETVERAHDRMMTLIDDLLTLTRSGRQIDEVESIDPAAVVEACWRTIDLGDTELLVEFDRPIRADRNRFQQLLENLFRNAIQHGGEDVTIRVGELEDRPGLFFEDDGPGFDDENSERVFESGFTTSENGHGFGLAIVKEIVEAHGWSIRATERDGGGARFEITGVEFDDSTGVEFDDSTDVEFDDSTDVESGK